MLVSSAHIFLLIKLQNATNRGGEKMVNTNKIKGRMRELEITQADVAKCLNIAQPTVNQKINNIRPFDLDEARNFLIFWV